MTLKRLNRLLDELSTSTDPLVWWTAGALLGLLIVGPTAILASLVTWVVR